MGSNLGSIMAAAVKPGDDQLPVTKVSSEKPLPVYEIWSRRLNKKVGEVTTREGATRSVDRRDIDYGGNDHYWKLAGEK
jgi:hypothetical protein